MNRDDLQTELKGQNFALSFGRLTSDKAKYLEIAHSFQPKGSEPLTEEDVFFFKMEAASDVLIDDRFIFLGKKTLKNMVACAKESLPFMNSHRTYSDTELPYGKVIDGSLSGGAVSFVAYMIRSVSPNGTINTDDVIKMMNAGIFNDVSVGLYGGEYYCDVCGNNVYARDVTTGAYLCPHWRGSQIGMSAEQVAKQKAKGVPTGDCTYTLEDALCNECSMVYNGAVKGAQVQSVFAKQMKLISSKESTMNEEVVAKSLFEQLKSLFTPKPDATPPVVTPDQSAEVAALKLQLAAEQSKANKAAIALYVEKGLLLPAQADAAVSLYEKDPTGFAALMANATPNVALTLLQPVAVAGKPGLVEGTTFEPTVERVMSAMELRAEREKAKREKR
jgi:hypothetical protein